MNGQANVTPSVGEVCSVFPNNAVEVHAFVSVGKGLWGQVPGLGGEGEEILFVLSLITF